ncbi:MAG: iron-containing alcohol dehydrogenase [Desulforegulaceae bacterium]|nr:iron-containing alcohol dehydrogenase [Desulforegulaceae bacterium]
MLPSYYQFYNPVKIISGNKALDNLPYELELLNSKRPLVVTDKGVENAGLIKVFINSFKNSGVEIGGIYSDVPPDSSNSVVKDIARVYREKKCDSLIAVGGGSPIDTAKGANILVTENSDDLMEFEGTDLLKKPLKPLIVVPTTAGTGSEATLVAVIYNEEKKVKMEFISDYLLPNLAVIDPRMTETMPPKITAATGMDALTHAIEAYTCLQKNPISDAYAFSAIRIISENILAAVENGKDRKARLNMANAATMAGIAFSNSMVGGIHALGHSTGAVAKVPHGVAMSIFLPYGLEYSFEKIKDSLSELLLPLSGPEIYSNTSKENRAFKFIENLRNLQRKLNEKASLPMRLKEAGVTEDMFESIATKTINDGALMMNPEEMSHEDAMGILKKAF